MQKVILLNGPAGSGKDTAFGFLQETLNEMFIRVSLADRIKIATHKLLGCCRYYEHCKDAPHEDFYGKTPRESYIHVAENARDFFGKDVFLNAAFREIQNDPRQFIPVITDLGFQIEADRFVETFGSENVLLIQLIPRNLRFEDSDSVIKVSPQQMPIHRKFYKDSRYYVDPSAFENHAVLLNNHDPSNHDPEQTKMFKSAAIAVVKHFLSRSHDDIPINA